MKAEDIDKTVFTDKEIKAAMALLAAFTPIAEVVYDAHVAFIKAINPLLKSIAEMYIEAYGLPKNISTEDLLEEVKRRKFMEPLEDADDDKT